MGDALMGIVDELRAASSAEDFFRLLEVDHDPQVLGPARLHILRRMGQSLQATPLEALEEAEARTRLRAALEAAYRDFVTSTPLEQRVFKVHRQARRALLFAPGGKPSR
jgi:nitrogenase-stabilizing/protective protein